jgi:hypothetical protein
MGVAKDGSKCFTRKDSSGKSYVTCKGTQKGAKPKAKPKAKAKVKAIKVVKGTKKSIDLKPTTKAVGRPRKPKETEAQKKARMTKQYREDYGNLSEATLKEYLERSESRREFHDLVAIPVLKQLIENKKGRVTGPHGGVDRFAARPDIPVYDTQQGQDMADISAYMTETGRIPMGPLDAGFIEFQASRGGLAKMKARSDKAKAKKNAKYDPAKNVERVVVERMDLTFPRGDF